MLFPCAQTAIPTSELPFVKKFFHLCLEMAEPSIHPWKIKYLVMKQIQGLSYHRQLFLVNDSLGSNDNASKGQLNVRSV